MPYNPVATKQLIHRPDNLRDWMMAAPGQWFIGVVDTYNQNIFLVPVNVFENAGSLNQQILNNIHPRAINRYASGAPGENSGVSSPFTSFRGANWLSGRPAGQTHHTCVTLHYCADPNECLGFTLIKVANQSFAQLKCGSISLNQKAGATLNHSFSRATQANSREFLPGTHQMPTAWIDGIMNYFRGPPFYLLNIVKSND